MSQNSPLELVRLAVFSFVNADDWRDSKRIVEEQQEHLLTDEADLLFAKLLVKYADDANTTRLLQEQHALLQRCRREGIDAAFADLLDPAMPDISPDLIVRLMSVKSEEEFTQLLRQHPELLPLMAAMPQAAPPQRTPEPPQEPIEKLMAFIYGETSSSDPQDVLIDKLMTFIYAENWSESKVYLAQHPELLTDEAFEVLSMLIEEEEDPDTLHTLREHRVLLAEVRQNGLDEAFAGLTPMPSRRTKALIALLETLMECNSPIAVLELAAQEPDLLSDEMDSLLQQGIVDARTPGIQEGEAIAARVEACYDILRQLRKTMAQTGKSAEQLVQSMRRRPEHSSQRPQRPSQALISAIEAFGAASSEAQRKHIVEQKRDLLLSDAALQLFDNLLEQYKEDARAIATFTEHRNLLIRCRKEGIEAAFADRVG